MDQTEWPVEDAPSYERQAQDHVFQGRIDAAADCYEKALRIRLKSGDKPSQLVHAAEVLARASNHACKIHLSPRLANVNCNAHLDCFMMFEILGVQVPYCFPASI